MSDLILHLSVLNLGNMDARVQLSYVVLGYIDQLFYLTYLFQFLLLISDLKILELH